MREQTSGLVRASECFKFRKGPKNLGCTSKDCRNFIDASRRLGLEEGDAEAICKLFLTMQERDRDFFHTLQVDDDNSGGEHIVDPFTQQSIIRRISRRCEF
ncbi:hypothetical protein Syun_004096 [Stephania yunnanensis]|uniref:Uncharacterized protein n=1 Tax=Stephania yunnanensis TaxID=152371 RepID=A0AAP0Q280_9MAGN